MTTTPLPETSAEEALDLPPTPEEQIEAQALALALEHQAPPFVQALQAAYSPENLDTARHEELLIRALAEAPQGRLHTFSQRWARVSLIAAAACFALLFGQLQPRNTPSTLVASRSTQDLFSEPFPKQGGQSFRMDRISASRTRELRSNQFATWGVK